MSEYSYDPAEEAAEEALRDLERKYGLPEDAAPAAPKHACCMIHTKHACCTVAVCTLHDRRHPVETVDGRNVAS